MKEQPKKKGTLLVNNPFSGFVRKYGKHIALILMVAGMSACTPSEPVEIEPTLTTAATGKSDAPVTKPPVTYHVTGVINPVTEPPVQHGRPDVRDEHCNICAQEKARLVEGMRADFANIRQQFDFSDEALNELLGQALEEHNPLLVGRNVVFDEKWLPLIQQHSTDEKFLEWRDNVDQVYDALADLTGYIPAHGQRVYIDIKDDIQDYHEDGKGAIKAHAHINTNVICYDPDAAVGVLREITYTDSINFTMVHELSHLFDGGNQERLRRVQPWKGGAEHIANFKAAYVLEHLNAVSYPTGAAMQADMTREESEYFWDLVHAEKVDEAWEYKNRVTDDGRPLVARGIRMQGDDYRNHKVERALRDRDNLKRYPAKSNDTEAMDLISFELVGAVGWEPFKKVFRSYDDENYKEQYGYLRYAGHMGLEWNNGPQERGREFLHRAEHFSGHSLSRLDSSDLIDKHFSNTPKTLQQLDVHIVIGGEKQTHRVGYMGMIPMAHELGVVRLEYDGRWMGPSVYNIIDSLPEGQTEITVTGTGIRETSRDIN